MKADACLIQALPANGIYTLVISLSRECLNVGKLGQQRFLKGHYTYTGSALGKGALSLKRRISRHIQKEKRNFWHIDFLLANENNCNNGCSCQDQRKIRMQIKQLHKNGKKSKNSCKRVRGFRL